MTSNEKRWYVVKTYPRKENVVYSNLLRKGFNVFLPIITTTFIRSGKVVSCKRPLISNYVFVNANQSQLSQLNFVVGTQSLLSNNDKPVIVTEKEVEQMERLCVYSPSPQVVGTYRKGQKLRITGGVLNGIEGEVISMGKRSKIVIGCGLPGYNFEIDIDNKMIEVL